MTRIKGRVREWLEAAARRCRTPLVLALAAMRRTQRDRARLLQLVDASTDFISLASLDTHLMYMNRSAREKLGLARDEDVRQLHLHDYVPQDQRKLLEETVLRTARECGVWEGEMQLQHMKTGKRIDVFRRTFLIRDPLTGKPDCYATVNQDISEFKREQAILRDNEDRMRIALEAARAGIFHMNLETREVQWSDEHFRLLDLPAPGHASYSLWRKHMHPDDFRRVAAEIQHTMDTGERLISEHRMVGASGEVLWVLAQAVILQRPGHARHLVGAIVDISRLKLAEAEARASERRFRIMADGAPANIWVSDARGRLEFVNREYCKFFGKTLEQEQEWQHLLHPDDAPHYLDVVSTALENQDAFRARTRVRSVSGEWRWLESSAVPRFAETGAFLGHVGLSMDVTEMVQSQQALQEADRRKDEFLAILSHELRNPLAPIRNAAAILASPKLTQEQMRWAQSVIERQTDTMSRLLEDLLNVARIAEGKLTLRIERVSLSSVVDAAIEAARPLIDRKNHKFMVNLPKDALTIQADPLRLSQVIANLLTNAAKYTDPGGHIAITARREDGALEITVKDDGIGIPPDALNRIFAMFEQVKGATSRSEGGLGIGLALVRGVVDLHGGTVKVRLVKGLRGTQSRHRLSVRALGLNKLNDVRELKDSPSVRGLITQLHYLVRVEE